MRGSLVSDSALLLEVSAALVREGSMRLEGNLDLMMANFLYLKLMLETLRGRV